MLSDRVTTTALWQGNAVTQASNAQGTRDRMAGVHEHSSREVHKIPVAAWGFSDPDSSFAGDGPGFKRIVLAVNDSAACIRAVAVAAGLARGSGSEVCVVHLVERVFFGRAGWCSMETAEEAKRIVCRFRAELEALGVGVTARTGKARHEELALDIVLTAAEYRADVIVIGMRHRSVLRAIICGSVANEIIRRSKIPVVAVP